MAGFKKYLIDEKVRGRNKSGGVYRDIFLETLSNKGRGTPGWVCKELWADFIAYLIAPIGVAYLLPVPELQEAWAKNAEEWTNQYGERCAFNEGYVTVGVPVPANVLLSAIGECRMVRPFEPFEYEE